MLLTEKVLVVSLAVSKICCATQMKKVTSIAELEREWVVARLMYACSATWSMGRSSQQLLLWSPPHFPSRQITWSTQSCCRLSWKQQAPFPLLKSYVSGGFCKPTFADVRSFVFIPFGLEISMPHLSRVWQFLSAETDREWDRAGL